MFELGSYALIYFLVVLLIFQIVGWEGCSCGIDK